LLGLLSYLSAMAKTAARALHGKQFNSGLAMGLIAGAAVLRDEIVAKF